MTGRQLERGRHPRRAGSVPRRSVVGIFAVVLEMQAHAGGRELQARICPSRHGSRGGGAGWERRSARAIALQRCAARMSGIDGPGITAEMLENPFNDRWRLDAGDDAHAAAALPAGFTEHIPVRDRFAATFGRANRQSCRFVDVDGKDPLEALCSSLIGRCRSVVAASRARWQRRRVSKAQSAPDRGLPARRRRDTWSGARGVSAPAQRVGQ